MAGVSQSFNFGALEERVTGLERGMAQVAASVDSLAHDVRERQKFPWPAIWGGVSVLLVIVGMFGGVVIWGFNSYLNTVATTLANQQAQVQAINAAIVPRGEHEERWRSQDAAVAGVQREIDQIRTDFGSTFSLNDTLKAIIQRIDRLEQIRLQQSAKTAD